MYPAALVVLLHSYLLAVYAAASPNTPTAAAKAVISQNGVHVKFTFKQSANGTTTISYKGPKGLKPGYEYQYHIHVNPPGDEDGNCEATGVHFDPLGKKKKGKPYKCSQSKPHKCEAGDLSGKYGGLELGAAKTVLDKALKVSDILGKSVVIHNLDTAKWACAKIVRIK